MTQIEAPLPNNTRVDRAAVPGTSIPALHGRIVDNRPVFDELDGTDQFLGYVYRIALDDGGFVKSSLIDGPTSN